MERELKEFTEYVNPNKIVVMCNDGFELVWESKNFPAGSRSKKYQLLLFLLNNYSESNCKKSVDRMLNLA